MRFHLVRLRDGTTFVYASDKNDGCRRAMTATTTEPDPASVLAKGNSLGSFFAKFRGDGARLPAFPKSKAVLLAWIGGYLAITALAGLSDLTSRVLLLGSLGASCVLVFGYPDIPFSQPRNVILGHCISSLIGLTYLAIFGAHWWAVGLAEGTAIAAMMLTRTVHPPAASNPIIVFLTKPAWSFLLYPTLLGAVILVGIALLYNNATRESRYPKYW